MLLGVLYALIAGLLWGLVFIVPLLLPNQSPALLSLGRYLAFGCVCVPLAAFQWRALRSLTARDWRWAFMLSVVGNLVYYGFLAFAIQTLGNPLPALIIGTLPVVIALCANLGLAQNQAAPRVAWSSLALPASLLLAGLFCVNGEELGRMTQLSAAQYWLVGGTVRRGDVDMVSAVQRQAFKASAADQGCDVGNRAGVGNIVASCGVICGNTDHASCAKLSRRS
jgi:drug/metabolite transporter (DMT)-like permease